MNRRAAALLVATAILIAVMFLFPPCLGRVTEWGRATLKHEGFRWIGSAAHGRGVIDWKSLLWMTGVACALSFLACLELRDGRTRS